MCDGSHGFCENKVLNLQLHKISTQVKYSAMSDENKKNKNMFFSNEDTIVRRAWIESALASVRSSLLLDEMPAADLPDVPSPAEQANSADSAQPAGPYLVWSADERRSGT